MTRLPQQRGAAVRQRQLLLSGVHAPDDAAHVARAHVDLVDHAPLVDDVEEAVLGQRRRLQVLVGRRSPDGEGIGQLQALDVVLVDLVERRVALRVVGAVVHQPVLRLLVGIDEPIRSHVAGEGRAGRERGGAARAEACGCCGSWSSSSIVFCLVARPDRLLRAALSAKRARAGPTRSMSALERQSPEDEQHSSVMRFSCLHNPLTDLVRMSPRQATADRRRDCTNGRSRC